jgi:hypothetical protein
MQHLVAKRRGNEMEQTIQLQPRRTVMKHLMISLLLAGGFIALSTMDASALVCARGVYRAGCVGAGGAAVVTRRVVRPVVVAPRRAVVVRRRVY